MKRLLSVLLLFCYCSVAVLLLFCTVGGDINNPVCNGVRQAGSITELYSTLAECQERVATACNIDQEQVG